MRLGGACEQGHGRRLVGRVQVREEVVEQEGVQKLLVELSGLGWMGTQHFHQEGGGVGGVGRNLRLFHHLLLALPFIPLLLVGVKYFADVGEARARVPEDFCEWFELGSLPRICLDVFIVTGSELGQKQFPKGGNLDGEPKSALADVCAGCRLGPNYPNISILRW